MSAGSCPIDPPVARTPPKSAAGTWNGDVLGVRMRLSLTEEGAPDAYFNLVNLTGTGWLIYGTPAESIAVGVIGANAGEPAPGVSFQLTTRGAGGDYGDFSGVWQTDGTLLGPLSRMPNIEPTRSPWPSRWPAGAQAVSLRLTRQ